METDFPRPGRACSVVSGLWGSSRGLVVLGADLWGVAPEVVGFLQVVRPALWDGRQPHVRHTHGVGGGGMHWEALLSAS